MSVKSFVKVLTIVYLIRYLNMLIANAATVEERTVFRQWTANINTNGFSYPCNVRSPPPEIEQEGGHEMGDHAGESSKDSYQQPPTVTRAECEAKTFCDLSTPCPGGNECRCKKEYLLYGTGSCIYVGMDT